MEENNQSPMFEDDSADQAKTWIQENLRVIVSVFIVAAIALGIYSYSQRTQTLTDEDSLLDTQGEEETASVTEEEDGMPSETPAVTERQDTGTAPAVAPELSRETETSFIEQAERGNGSTHLARRALAHYLEKNPDSSLSAEHKIYIEDYLRKNVGHTGPVPTPTSI